MLDACSHASNKRAATGGSTPTSSFEGTWSIARRIMHYDSGQLWTFAGSAEITARTFVEQGWLTRAGTTVAASRGYILDISEPGRVNVRQHDGRLFITLTEAPIQAIAHECGSDLYSGRFTFPGSDRWIETWRVRGQRKNYRSFTRYDRVST